MAWHPFRKSRVYLDWASAAPVHPRACASFLRALSVFGNPSSPHTEGTNAKELLEASRIRIARLAGVKPRAVVFTSGATEANALAIQGRVQKCSEAGMAYADMHVLYLPTMHASVLRTVEQITQRGVTAEAIPLTDTGSIDLSACEKLLRPQTILVCADAVCGETGTRFDTLRLRRLVDARKDTRAVLHVDASQLPLVEPIEHTRLGADLLTLDAQKVGGVRGIGALVVPQRTSIAPLMVGGGQEGGLRPGTEAVALATSFAEALSVCAAQTNSFAASARHVRIELITTVESSLPRAVIYTTKHQAPHILNLSLPGIDTDYLVMLLDQAGFAVSTKSACETDSEDGSRAVYVLTQDRERAKSTLRISWGPSTRQKDIHRFANSLISTVRFLEASAIY